MPRSPRAMALGTLANWGGIMVGFITQGWLWCVLCLKQAIHQVIIRLLPEIVGLEIIAWFWVLLVCML